MYDYYIKYNIMHDADLLIINIIITAAKIVIVLQLVRCCRRRVLHQLLMTSQLLRCLHEAHRPLQRQRLEVRVQWLYTCAGNQCPAS